MKKSFAVSLCLSSTCLAWTPGVMAQVGPQEQVKESGGGLNEIVVTARRVSESLQDTPVAVTAVTGEALEQRGLADVSGLQNFIPNVTFNPTSSNSGSSNAAVIFIRGIGQSDFYPQVDPGVGIYLDGVYISRTTGAVLDAVDIGQIEVLRGPQGTLYGKNTIGGAINIASRRPENQLGGYLELTTGRYNRIDAKARLDLPISDTLKTSFSFSTLNRDGYYDILDFETGQKTGRLGNASALTARFAADLEVTPSLELQFSADWTQRREESSGSTLLRINPNGLAPLIFNNVTGPTIGPDAIYDDRFLAADRFSNFGDPTESQSDLDVWGISLIGEWDTSDWLTIKSITAYRESESDSNRDGDGSPFQILNPLTIIEQSQFSQEIQFLGSLLDDRLTFIAGGYYLDENVFFDAPVNIAFVSTDNSADIANKSYAGFGQLGYSFADDLRLTLGARYTVDEKRNDARVFATRLIDPATMVPVPDFVLPIPLLIDDARRTDKEFTPAVTLDYKFTPDVFGYFTYSRGFKSGGFSQRIAFPRDTAPAFDPEEVENYEVGLKIEAFNRRLRINSAAFYTDYTNLQVIIFNNVEPQTQNGGEATIKGFETEIQASPVDDLNFSFAVGYLDSNYDEINPGTLIPDGAALAYTPEWTLSASLNYVFETGNIGIITPQIDWSYRSAVFFDALNTPELRQPGYHLVNANISFTDLDEHWRMAIGVTNIFNKNYLIGGFSDLPATGFVDGTFARPREWFLSVKRNF